MAYTQPAALTGDQFPQEPAAAAPPDHDAEAQGHLAWLMSAARSRGLVRPSRAWLAPGRVRPCRPTSDGGLIPSGNECNSLQRGKRDRAPELMRGSLRGA